MQINERYFTTEDTKWNLLVKVYLSIYLLYIIFVSVIWIFYMGTGVYFIRGSLISRFLTIAKNAKLKTREVKYQSGMLPSPRD